MSNNLSLSVSLFFLWVGKGATKHSHSQKALIVAVQQTPHFV